MLRLAVAVSALLGVLALKSPAWLSIESPVSPYDSATRGAVLLVHTRLAAGTAKLEELSGSAEGIVNGARRSVPLHFTDTPTTSVFALRRQWPAEGRWILRISLRETTALVSLDEAGNSVTGARVPTTFSQGWDLPRAVTAREIDSALADAVRR